MSQENVGLARRAFEAVRRGDHKDAEGCFLTDVEWHNTSGFPGPRTIVGPKAIIEFSEEMSESFDAEGEEIEEIKAGGDCVVMGVRTWGRAKGSGIPMDVRWAITFTLTDGKIARIDVRGDYAKAVQAAGLSE